MTQVGGLVMLLWGSLGWQVDLGWSLDEHFPMVGITFTATLRCREVGYGVEGYLCIPGGLHALGVD